jgi:endogenous inhibitor of DNA gyrase (YacG/DUF329 family)
MMEDARYQLCPRCGRMALKIYYSSKTDEKLGARCQKCDLQAYFSEHGLVSMGQYR